MSKILTSDQLLALGRALIRLREETFSRITRATEIRGPNISAWLKGKPQVISNARQAVLLEYLGIQRAALRRDVLHVWTVDDDLADVRTVLETLLVEEEREQVVIFNGPAPEKEILLRIPSGSGHAVVRVDVAPGLSGEVAITAKTLGHGLDCSLSHPVGPVPPEALECLKEELHKAAADQLGVLVESELEAASPGARDLTTLRSELAAALREGVDPNLLAAAIATIRAKTVDGR